MATEDPAAVEYLALLTRAGIAMAPERLAEAVAEFLDLRTHVERVNAACLPDAEPIAIFTPPHR